MAETKLIVKAEKTTVSMKRKEQNIYTTTLVFRLNFAPNLSLESHGQVVTLYFPIFVLIRFYGV